MENNPYIAPEAELNEKSSFRRSIWWKIYFFFITAVAAMGMISLFFTPRAGFVEVISLLTWLIATVGMFGFCFLKRVFRPGFWLPFLIVYLGYGIAYYFITNIDLKMGMNDTDFFIINAVAYLMTLPGYYALYMYGKPNKQPWVGA